MSEDESDLDFEMVIKMCDNCGCSEFWYYDGDYSTVAECKECGTKHYPGF